jgi:hypothetical protein
MDDFEGIQSAMQRQWTLTSVPTGLHYYLVDEMTLTRDENFQRALIPITARITADVRS